MHKRDPKVIMKLLQNVTVLESLSAGQLQRMADALQEVSYTDGQYIIRQGEIGSEFYAIESGEVVCTIKKGEVGGLCPLAPIPDDSLGCHCLPPAPPPADDSYILTSDHTSRSAHT